MSLDETGQIVRLCINFRVFRPRKSRVYLARSFSPMSDSHVNDIRYTALWRPVVKARKRHLLRVPLLSLPSLPSCSISPFLLFPTFSQFPIVSRCWLSFSFPLLVVRNRRRRSMSRVRAATIPQNRMRM